MCFYKKEKKMRGAKRAMLCIVAEGLDCINYTEP